MANGKLAPKTKNKQSIVKFWGLSRTAHVFRVVLRCNKNTQQAMLEAILFSSKIIASLIKYMSK